MIIRIVCDSSEKCVIGFLEGLMRCGGQREMRLRQRICGSQRRHGQSNLPKHQKNSFSGHSIKILSAGILLQTALLKELAHIAAKLQWEQSRNRRAHRPGRSPIAHITDFMLLYSSIWGFLSHYPPYRFTLPCQLGCPGALESNRPC